MSGRNLMNRSMKIIIAAALIGGAASWYFKAEEQSGSYLTQKLEKGDITEKITASGTINPISTINIGTQVSGTISEIYVDYNSKVKKDQLLAQIDPALFEATVGQRRAALNVSKAEVQVAENEVDYAKKNLARIKKLNASRYSADKELDLAEKEYNNSVAQLALKKAQVEQAQAALDSAETELRYTKIISPVEGIVVSKEVEVGQTVAASFQTPTLFNVAEDLTKMQIEASVVVFNPNFAGVVDINFRCIVGNGNLRLNNITVMRYDHAVAVLLKSAVAGIGNTFAFRQFNLKITAPLNSQIQRIVGVGQTGTAGNPINCRGTHAQTELNAGRNHCLRSRRRRSRTNDILIQQVVKFGPALGISRRVHIGNIVGNNVNVRLLGQHAGCTDC